MGPRTSEGIQLFVLFIYSFNFFWQGECKLNKQITNVILPPVRLSKEKAASLGEGGVLLDLIILWFANNTGKRKQKKAEQFPLFKTREISVEWGLPVSRKALLDTCHSQSRRQRARTSCFQRSFHP